MFSRWVLCIWNKRASFSRSGQNHFILILTLAIEHWICVHLIVSFLINTIRPIIVCRIRSCILVFVIALLLVLLLLWLLRTFHCLAINNRFFEMKSHLLWWKCSFITFCDDNSLVLAVGTIDYVFSFIVLPINGLFVCVGLITAFVFVIVLHEVKWACGYVLLIDEIDLVYILHP